MYKKGLFNDWVSRPVQLLLFIIFLIPFLTVSGVYAGNISEMVGGLGSLSEDITMANYAGTIGMVVTFPLLMRTKQRFKVRHLLLFSFISLTILTYVCLTTDNMKLLIAASFLLGCVKMIGMGEVIVPVMFIISPQGDRTKFYSVFYPLAIAMTMLSTYFTAIICYDYNWQHVYLLVITMLLFCIFLVIIFCHNSYGSKPIPLYRFDWLSLVVFATAMMLLNYAFSYGKMLNWFDSNTIQIVLFAAAILIIIFVHRQLTIRRPYLPLVAFGKKNVYVALILVLIMGVFSSTSGIQNSFTGGILRYSSLTNASLNLMTVVGAIAGGMVSFLWLRYKLGMKGLILTGFSTFILYHIVLYFLFNPIIDISYMGFPSFLKGLGTMLLYIALGVYAAQKLGFMQFLSTVPIQILFRSFIGPAFWGSLYSYQQHNGQMKHTAAIVQQMDSNDPFFTSRLNPIVQGAIAQGQSVEAARSTGIQSMWGAVQSQASLAASKELFGYIILLGFIVLIVVLLLRFEPINLRPWVKLRKSFRKNEPTSAETEILATIAP